MWSMLRRGPWSVRSQDKQQSQETEKKVEQTPVPPSLGVRESDDDLTSSHKLS